MNRYKSAMSQRHGTTRADWLRPQRESSDLNRRFETVRQRWRLIAAFTALGLGVALLYLATTPKTYEAEAELLVKPIPADEAIFAAVGLITESNDPSLGVQTAVQLVDTPAIATEAADDLGLEEGVASVLARVEVEPIPQSNIVAVIAQGGSPEEARDLANAFSEAAVEARTAEIRENVAEVLPRLESQLNRLPSGGDAAESLASTISELRFLSAGNDPTIALESPAELPTAPSRPRPTLSVALGLLGGFAAGLLAAFALQFLDPVLRRETQLRGLLRVPVLARVPHQGGRDDKPLLPTSLTIQSREAYRTLRATLAAAGSGVGPPKSTLVTGPGAAEGKSTTALNLAISLALSGSSVLLIESDLRRPSIGAVLGIEPERGVVSVLIEQTALEDAIVTTKAFGPNLQLLLADHTGPGVPELLSLPAAQRLLRRAEALADYVIIDSPPLTDVIDALPLARQVDAVLLVVRLGKSRLARIRRLGELLSANDIRPIGFTVLGTGSNGTESDYHYYGETPERPDWKTLISTLGARFRGTGR